MKISEIESVKRSWIWGRGQGERQQKKGRRNASCEGREVKEICLSREQCQRELERAVSSCFWKSSLSRKRAAVSKLESGSKRARES